MEVLIAAQRVDEHLRGPPCEQILLLRIGPESADCVFERRIRRLTDLIGYHQTRLKCSLNETQKQKEHRHALQWSRVLASYQKLHIFAKFLWSSALCEYLAATVGPVLDSANASKHAAVLHLRLFRRQAHIRGDSAGATAIQTMHFWTRPDRGLLSSSLSRWVALLMRRRAKRRLEKLADTQFRDRLSFRAFTAWRPSPSDQPSCDSKPGMPAQKPCGSPLEKHKLTVKVGSCAEADEAALHQHRGASVASARMRQHADGSRSPDKRLSAYPLSPPSLTQPPWSPSGPSKSSSCTDKHMPNLELLRKRVVRRQKSPDLPRQALSKQSTPQAYQSWISTSSSFRDNEQPSPRSSFRACQPVQG